MDDLIIESSNFNDGINIDKDYLNSLIQEAFSKIPYPQQFRSKVALNRLYEECGKKAFLDPQNKAYPIMDPKTCDYDCSLLNRAYYELAISSNIRAKDLRDKARSIMENLSCRHRIMVKIQDDVVIELDHLISLLS